MSTVVDELSSKYAGVDEPFLLGAKGSLRFEDIRRVQDVDLSSVSPGDVVALIGDFNARSIATMLRLIDLGVVLVPLTEDTESQHEYFLEQARVNVVIRGQQVDRRPVAEGSHPLLDQLRERGNPGLVLFSSGSTGRPKAILHDLSNFLVRYRTPRPTWRTLAFLRFDHIGGINTLLHTLFNRGLLVVPSALTPTEVVDEIRRFEVELFPTTPTFLRMLLLAGLLDEARLPSVRVITYGTEKMDQPTLDRLSRLLPRTEFRQTYGMSELGILRVKSKSRDSLWIQVGGEGIEIRVVDSVLQIKSDHRMLGYLNAPDPFEHGWYDTGDIVEEDAGYLKIVGRSKEVINIGGLKILPSEIERVALLQADVLRAKASGADNPLTGQHIEIICQLKPGSSLDRQVLRRHFAEHLPEAFRPQRIRIGDVVISHRFKQA